MGKVARTDKQVAVMGIVLDAFNAGTPASVGEIRARLLIPSKPSAMSSTLRWLEEKGMIIRKYNGRRQEVHPTTEAYAWFKARSF